MDRELLTKEVYLKKLSRHSLNTARGHNTSINTFENWHKRSDFDLFMHKSINNWTFCPSSTLSKRAT